VSFIVLSKLITSFNELLVFRTLQTIFCDSDNQKNGIKIRTLFYLLQMTDFYFLIVTGLSIQHFNTTDVVINAYNQSTQ
jgi:hypothetical protein